jgi:serpin B
MRSATFALCVLLLLGAAPLAQAQKLDPEVETLVQGNSDFAMTLHKQLAAKGGNAFFSPYSISNALAMTYAGAKNETADQMKTTLRFNLADNRLHPAFGKLSGLMEGNGKRPFQLTIANRLWGERTLNFFPEFLAINKDSYGAGMEQVDFKGNPEEARKMINDWVEKKTNQKIKDLIPPKGVSPITRLVLTNAIFFKASWHVPFDEKKTKDETFYLADGTEIKTPLMHSKANLRFADHGDFTICELPYEKHEASMLVILPKKKDGLGEVEKKLTPAALAEWMKPLAGHDVDLKFPKFKMTSSFSLGDHLKEMGMVLPFDKVNADFKGMASNPDGNHYIFAVLHKAFLGVDEKSTEAAAATAVIVNKFKSKPKLPPEATFHVDRPFMLLIRDHATGSILFMGRVVDPR